MSLKCNHQGKWCSYLPVSMGGEESSFSWYLVPNPLPFTDIRNLFFLWIKAISKHRWPPQLPGEFRTNYVWQIMLSRLLIWGLINCLFRKMNAINCTCLTIWKVRFLFVFVISLMDCLQWASHCVLMVI